MDYNNSTLTELREIAKTKGIKSITKYKKEELLSLILETETNVKEPEPPSVNEEKAYLKELDSGQTGEGILEVTSNGYGFLRSKNYLSSSNDIYVSASQISRFNLKTGDVLKGIIRIPRENEKFSALLFVNSVNGDAPSTIINRKNFEKLTPIYPQENLTLELTQKNVATRIIDIICPIGKGQRGLIVAPPKTGKTTLLKLIANSLIENHKDINLIILLIDERPEEVTDIQHSIKGENVEIIYSTFDEQPEHHKKVAEMVLERGKRLAEQGKNPVILLDSITRLSRAYNLITPSSGKTLSGGLDPSALYMPKKFFGAARNIQNGGSLTIIATALVNTGSKMDDIIFEEFKGTGNMELVLDKNLSEKRIFPAIDITKSGTRKEELLLDKTSLDVSYQIRKLLTNNQTQNIDTIRKIIDLIENTKSNENFIKNYKQFFQKYL